MLIKDIASLFNTRNIHPIIVLTAIFFAIVGLYRVFFTPVTFDEVNYLIKGAAFVSGQSQPYEYYSFYTGYPPLSYWASGLTQFFGPSILFPRIISYVLLIFIFGLTVFIGYRLGGKKLAVLTAALLALSTGFTRIFIQLPPYPQSALLILLAILLLVINSKNKLFQLTSILLLIIASYLRLQAVITLLAVIIFLFFQEKSNLYRVFGFIFLVGGIIILALPFYPGIIRVLTQIPPLGLFPPSVTGIHSLQLSTFYKDITLTRKIFAIYRFLIYYSSFLFLAAFLIIGALWTKRKKFKQTIPTLRPLKIETLLALIVFLNVIGVLFFSFFSLCPSCSITYLSLILPLIILSLGLGIISVYDKLATADSKALFKIIILFGFLWTFTPSPYHQIDFPYSLPPTISVKKAADHLSRLIPKNEEIFTLGGQQYWYLAGFRTYPPLVNGLYTFRISENTGELLKYGYWNKEIALKWAKEANWALIDEREIENLRMGGDHTRDLLNELQIILEENFHPLARISGQGGEKIAVFKKGS